MSNAIGERVNGLHSLIPYGYTTPFSGIVSGTAGVTCTRNGTRYTFNCTLSANATPQKVMLGETMASWAGSLPATYSTIKLTDGHRYRLWIKHISGTATNNVYAAVYKDGTITNIATGTYLADGHYAEFVYDDETYPDGVCLAFAIRKKDTGNTLTNYCCDIWLEDITCAGDANIAPVEGVTAASTHNSGDLVL
ncbi:MAG: hypothetical protein J6V72_10205, partial [Kiritimatiellae bacterium]|nr:hypothetical protein [Kiritimatiellia bacterium]